ncbi:DUF4826 family protein [Colwellia sp. RSH04]|uniref:DUF4826 family protein n=1 Tax=Colwellia sp. RSH04 TaxID=2305464 RepID=UPI002174D64D|nr:DUF4826 family protein [Colwellia sp. RSH04]
MTQAKQMTEAEQQQWTREQYQVATKYLATKGLITQSVIIEESRYLVPILAVWKLSLNDGSKVWVLCGDLPTDHSSVDVASSAREALRHFALKWQMQAENLFRAEDKSQTDFANLLVSRSEGLYQLYEDDALWQ